MRDEYLLSGLNDYELQSINGGGLFLSIICGIGTVASTIGAAIIAPAAAPKIFIEGTFLTIGVYVL